MLLGKVKQDRVGIENRHAVVDDRWNLGVRIDLSEVGGMLLAFEYIDADHVEWRLQLFEEHGDFHRIRGGVKIQLQHWLVLRHGHLTWRKTYARSSRGRPTRVVDGTYVSPRCLWPRAAPICEPRTRRSFEPASHAVAHLFGEEFDPGWRRRQRMGSHVCGWPPSHERGVRALWITCLRNQICAGSLRILGCQNRFIWNGAKDNGGVKRSRTLVKRSRKRLGRVQTQSVAVSTSGARA